MGKDGKVEISAEISEAPEHIAFFQQDHQTSRALLRHHRAAWLIPPSEINLDIDCVRCECWCVSGCLSQRERRCLIETEPVGLLIYGLVRSSFPRVHSSLPSTRRHGAKPLLSFLHGGLIHPHLGKVKAASVCLNRSKGNSFLSLHFDLRFLYFSPLIYWVYCAVLIFLFLCFMWSAEKEKEASVSEGFP